MCYLHRYCGRSSCLFMPTTRQRAEDTKLRWLGPLSRYFFVVAMYTFYTLSQVPNRKGNRMCRSPDAARCERFRIQFRSSEDCSVSFKQCPISVRSRAVKEYVCTCPNLSFCPRPDCSLTVKVAARSERFDGICPHRRRMLCSLKPWRVVPVPCSVLHSSPHSGECAQRLPNTLNEY